MDNHEARLVVSGIVLANKAQAFEEQALRLMQRCTALEEFIKRFMPIIHDVHHSGPAEECTRMSCAEAREILGEHNAGR